MLEAVAEVDAGRALLKAAAAAGVTGQVEEATAAAAAATAEAKAEARDAAQHHHAQHHHAQHHHAQHHHAQHRHAPDLLKPDAAPVPRVSQQALASSLTSLSTR